jgi:hypothetical protein
MGATSSKHRKKGQSKQQTEEEDDDGKQTCKHAWCTPFPYFVLVYMTSSLASIFLTISAIFGKCWVEGWQINDFYLAESIVGLAFLITTFVCTTKPRLPINGFKHPTDADYWPVRFISVAYYFCITIALSLNFAFRVNATSTDLSALDSCGAIMTSDGIVLQFLLQYYVQQTFTASMACLAFLTTILYWLPMRPMSSMSAAGGDEERAELVPTKGVRTPATGAASAAAVGSGI